MCKAPIIPYFKDKKIKLIDLKPKDIQDFYTLQLKRVKASTVIHYHSVIHKALKYAVKIDLIPSNPASKIERPRQERFVGSFYDSHEVNQLFELVRGTNLELPVLLGAFYGLRRSEVVGLKWSAIDFNNNTLVVKHTVTSFNIDGHHLIYASDSTKNKSSMRTLPLVPAFKEKLLGAKEHQEMNRKLCGRSYSKDYLDYICVNELGVRLRPGYITTAFPKLLEDNGLRRIRFHDLRHSCASLLLANNVPMKQIQDWLGHSDFSTTANIYAHLDYTSKISSAQAMVEGLNFVVETPKELIQNNDSI
jgi:integrase